MGARKQLCRDPCARPGPGHSSVRAQGHLSQIRPRQRRHKGRREGHGCRTRDGAPHHDGSRRRNSSRERTGAGKHVHPASAGNEGSMTRILVVEDEPAIALGLEDDLKMEGYAVDVAATAKTALEHARGNAYDLIILDIMLPDRDGFEVCRTLRKDGLRTPILMLTAKAQEAEKVMGLELGADDYITKPFGTRELR